VWCTVGGFDSISPKAGSLVELERKTCLQVAVANDRASGC